MNLKSFETKRLLLKPTTTDDAGFILELMNTPKWLEYIGDRNVRTLEAAGKYIREKITPQFERLGFANYTLVRKTDGVSVGTCGLYDREGLDGIDIGFALLPAYERQGYAFEAASRLMEAARDFGIGNISAITTPANISSQNLLDKLGLKLTGTVRLKGDDQELLLYRKVP